VPVFGAQTDRYDVTVDRQIDVPDRTIDTEWGEYTVSSIGRYQTDDYLSVSTSAPADASYSIRLIDSQERVRANDYGEGDAEASFSLRRYDPGTYVVAMTNGTDEVLALEPFVISGYAVTQSLPTEVEADTTLRVNLSLTKVDSDVATPASVEVAVTDGSTTLRSQAARTTGLNYTATFDAGRLSTGEYDVYTAVQRDNEVYGEKELVGLSAQRTVTVVEPSESTTTVATTATTPTTPSQPGSSDGETTTTAPTETTSATTRTVTKTSEETRTTTEQSNDDSTRTATTASPTTDAGSTIQATETTVSDGSQATTTSTTTAQKAPLVPDLTVFLAGLLLLAGWSRLR
jgi:hypothetical protein